MDIKNVVIKFEADYRDSSVLLATNLCSILEKADYICTKHILDDWGKEDINADAVIHIQGQAPYYTKPWNYNILLTQAYPFETEKRIIPIVAEVEEENYDAVHVGQDFETSILTLLADAVPSGSVVESRIMETKEKMLDPKFRKDGPLVSILMGTYNRRHYLPRAINSILDQTYENWELLLICDGGEAVDDIVEGFKDKRIKLINLKKNMGLGYGFNLAFKESNGEYIAYLGDDDIFLPNHIEKLMRSVFNIPGLSFVYSDAIEITIETDSFGNENAIAQNVPYFLQVDIGQLLESNGITGISVLHERSLFMQAGAFDPKLAVLIDFDMWRRLACYAYPYHISANTAAYFIHNNKQEPHLTDLYTKDQTQYLKNKLRIVFKKLPIETNEIYKSALSYIREKTLFEFYTQKCIDNDKNSRLRRIFLERAKRYYVEVYSSQVLFALCLIIGGDFLQALEVYKNIFATNEKKNTDMFRALYCALKLHDEYAFTMLALLSENMEQMDDNERALLNDYLVKIKKVFRKK